MIGFPRPDLVADAWVRDHVFGRTLVEIVDDVRRVEAAGVAAARAEVERWAAVAAGRVSSRGGT